MTKIEVIKPSKQESDIEKVLQNKYKFLLLKRSYKIVKCKLKYLPYVVSTFRCDTKNNKSKRANMLYVIINALTSKKQVFPDITGIMTEYLDVEREALVECVFNLEEEKLNVIKYLKFVTLPRVFHSFQNYQIELINSKIMYRVVWLVNWENAKNRQMLTVIEADDYNINL